MDDTTTTATLDQIDEDILTDTVFDEALEAAAGTDRGAPFFPHSLPVDPSYCCR
jgi:hypothetical protein